ncbi:MAG: amidohydrolase family protein [Vicinamibacterales bacterium]
MTLVRAAWVVPVDQRPLADGWVAVDDGRIVAVGSGSAPACLDGPTRNLGQVALLPGLVNTHVHLELSWLRNRVPPSNAFTSWVTQLFAARGASLERPDDPRVLETAAEAAKEARAAGTSAVGDIGNSLTSVLPIASSGMRGLVFHELIGFKETTGELVARTGSAREAASRVHGRVRVSVAPHAPYSVSPELFRAIRAEVDRSAVPFTSVHVGESPEEMELLAAGTGEWVRILRWIGAWRDDWQAPGTGPVEYLDGLGVIDARTMVVHGVQLSDESLGVVRARGATLVTCPRSNQWVGVGVPPIERFYEAGVPVAVGTDSLASVEDLNLFSELKAMRWLAPGVPASRLLESATLAGARALGLDADLGSLTPGKLAEIVAVALPEDVTDVEEHLVSGVDVRQVSWAHQA